MAKFKILSGTRTYRKRRMYRAKSKYVRKSAYVPKKKYNFSKFSPRNANFLIPKS